MSQTLNIIIKKYILDFVFQLIYTNKQKNKNNIKCIFLSRSMYGNQKASEIDI